MQVGHISILDLTHLIVLAMFPISAHLDALRAFSLVQGPGRVTIR